MFAQIFNYSHAYTPMVPHNVMFKIDNHDNCSDFLEKMAEHEISGLILIQEASKQLASSVVTRQPCISSYCEQRKLWQ